PFEHHRTRADVADDLEGEIDAPAELYAGMPLPVDAEVSNLGDGDLADVEITLLLVDPDSDAVLDSHLEVLPIAAGDAVAIRHEFDTSPLVPGRYRLELRAAGNDGVDPFDLELDRTAVRLEAGLEIPTLDAVGLAVTVLLLLMSALLVLRRRKKRFAMLRQSPGARGRHLWIVLLVALPLAAPDAARAEAACGDRFPLAQRLLDGGVAEKVTLDAAALGRELAIEAALLREELDEQRGRLDGRGTAEALERLAGVEGDALGRLGRLEASVGGAGLDKAELDALLGCPHVERTAISSQLAPPRAPRAKRGASRAEGVPDGYLRPPSPEVLDATSSAPGPGERAEKAAEGEAVRAKVQELGADPVALYHFVLNEIAPSHSFGAISGPAAVLAAGAGNDADQAGLLAALLREAGFPARLAWGVQEVPLAALENHLGARGTRAVERILTEAGVPW
ncbi:MAG: transglutaminase-like domain-containing protein, partial [Acidobacteriota bacterium]